MSIQVSHSGSGHSDGAPQQVEYPAIFHFRVITEASSAVEPELTAVLAAYRVTESLAASCASSSGRFCAYGVSVEVRTPEELRALDAALKRVPGVRMVL
jgi:putative lipoic acid-binding regulatory protein